MVKKSSEEKEIRFLFAINKRRIIKKTKDKPKKKIVKKKDFTEFQHR
jgi:hypothetical protein